MMFLALECCGVNSYLLYVWILSARHYAKPPLDYSADPGQTPLEELEHPKASPWTYSDSVINIMGQSTYLRWMWAVPQNATKQAILFKILHFLFSFLNRYAHIKKPTLYSKYFVI